MMERSEEEILKTLSKIKKIYAKKQKKLEKHIRSSKAKAHVKQKLKEQSYLKEKQNVVDKGLKGCVEKDFVDSDTSLKAHVVNDEGLKNCVDSDKGLKDGVCETSQQVSDLGRVSECKGDVNKSDLTGLNGEDLIGKKKKKNVLAGLNGEDLLRKNKKKNDFSVLSGEDPRGKNENKRDLTVVSGEALKRQNENKSDYAVLKGKNLERKNERARHDRTGRNKNINNQITHTKGDNSGKSASVGFSEAISEISHSTKCDDTLISEKILDDKSDENVKCDSEGEKCNRKLLDHGDDSRHGYNVTSDLEHFRVLGKSNSQLSHLVVTKKKLSLKKNKDKEEDKRENILKDSVDSTCLSLKNKNLLESENINDASSNCSDSLFSQDIFQEASVSDNGLTESKDELNTCILNIGDIENDSVSCENSMVSKKEDAMGCENYTSHDNKESEGCGNHAVRENKDSVGCGNHMISGNTDSEGCGNHTINGNENSVGCGNHTISENKDSVDCGNHKISKNKDSVGFEYNTTSACTGKLQKKSVKERRKSCPEMANFFLKEEQDWENTNTVNVRRRKRRSRLSMPRRNSPQLRSSQSDCKSVTSESSEEYQTLKLIQENYCLGLDRTTRKRNLTNSPLLISSVFQYFIDEGRRQKGTEDFTLPIIPYGILIQNKVDLCHETLTAADVQLATNDIQNENKNPDSQQNSEKSTEITKKSENKEKDENQLQYNHQLSFKPPDFENLVSVDVCSIEQKQKKNIVVMCLYKQYISLWKQENNSFVSFKRLQLPQGHTILRSYQLFSSDEVLSFVIKVMTNQGHPSFMVAMFEISDTSDCILPVVSFKSQRACVCCLKDSYFVISGDNVVAKYSFDADLHVVSSLLTLDKASGETTSLQPVDGIDSALLGITDRNELHVWNHDSGSLLWILDVTSEWSCPSILTDAFWDEGYFIISMLTLDEADSSGCLMMINPHTDQYKVLHQYQTSHWNGYKHIFQLPDSSYLGAIDKQQTLHIWDTFSGTEILTETFISNISQFEDIIVIQRSNCIHVFKLS